MSRTLLIGSLVFVCLACSALSQEEEVAHFTMGGVEVSDILKKVEDAYRTAVEGVLHAAEEVKIFAETSYEEHLRPVLEPVLEPSITWINSVLYDVKIFINDFWHYDALHEDDEEF